jgi:hypothetical protein
MIKGADLKFLYLKVIALIILFFILLSAQNPIFYKERVELHIKKDNCRVTGTYYFKNNGTLPVDKMIYYPISKNYGLLEPDSINVYNLSNDTLIPHASYKEGISFSLFIPAEKTVVYQVIYFQKTPNQKVEYILTTTKSWNRPLESAEFIIKLHSGLSLESLSMEYEYKKISNNYTSYFISRHNFMPDSNLIIEWR